MHPVHHHRHMCVCVSLNVSFHIISLSVEEYIVLHCLLLTAQRCKNRFKLEALKICISRE